jgi:hypothetical protein
LPALALVARKAASSCSFRRSSESPALNLQEKRRPSCHQLGASLPQPVNDPFIQAIVERIRAVVSRQSADALEAFAKTLGVSPTGFRAFIGEQDHVIDVLFLIDVVAAFARELAVDPQWLLIGQYDATTHREALLLGEDRSTAGAGSLREFVHRLYEQLRSSVDFSSKALRALRE